MINHAVSFFIFLALFITSPLSADVKSKKKTVEKPTLETTIKTHSPFYAVCQEYMKGYAAPTLDDEDETPKKKLRLIIPEIPIYTQYAKTYALFSGVPVTISTVCNRNTWDDLEILVGEHKQSINLMNFLDRTTTSFGKIYLTYLVATPIADIQKLKSRQAVVKEFSDNRTLRASISSSLSKIKTAENNFFYLWQEETDQNFKAINSFFFSSNLPGVNLLKKGNTNPYFMEALCAKGRLVSVGISLAGPILYFAFTRGIYSVTEKARGRKDFEESGKADELYKKLFLEVAKKHRANPEAAYGMFAEAQEEASTLTKLMHIGDGIIYNNSNHPWDLAANPKAGGSYIVAYPDIAISFLKKAKCEDLIPLVKAEAEAYSKNLLQNKKAFDATLNIHNPLKKHLIEDPNNPQKVLDPSDTTKSISRSKALEKIGDLGKLTLGDWHTNCKITDKEHELGALKYFYTGTAIGLSLEALPVLAAYYKEDAYNNLTNYLHTQMLAVATVVQELRALNKHLHKNHVLAHNLEHAAHIKALFDAADDSVSPKLHQLAQLLLTSTFNGQPSYFSLKGRVLAAYALMKQIKDELAPALIALGEIDALLSCALLMEEASAETNCYTFAQYVQQDTPYICMEAMWNPFVGAKKSVVNSIELGGKNPRNVILTGPNAGGKSTFSKGLTLNVLLAQTIGIVPAKQLTLTVFDKINSYMNITDDTAGGNSLFKSEVLRAQELLNTIKNLSTSKFSFSVMDEMFSGTSPKEGEAASYAVAKNIGSQENSIALIATHFPRLKGLEKDTTWFKNYQVRVVRHENGSFSYPFKLEEGAADQNVAIDILQQQGFDSSILNDAHAILQEPVIA